jgi:hypothetical protein
MLLVKLGILAVLGKSYYSGFLVAHLVNHLSNTLKHKLREAVK